jgi:hypothetical protein
MGMGGGEGALKDVKIDRLVLCGWRGVREAKVDEELAVTKEGKGELSGGTDCSSDQTGRPHHFFLGEGC